MPTHSQVHGPSENTFEGNEDWRTSIYKSAFLLSDPGSLSDEIEFFSHNDMNYNNPYEIQPKIVKAEPSTDLFTQEVHHCDWRRKIIDHWTAHDCMCWLISELQDLEVVTLPEFRFERMNMDGTSLKLMTVDDFNRLFPQYGIELFNRLQKFKVPFQSNNFYTFDEWSSNTYVGAEMPFPHFTNNQHEPHTLTDLDNESRLSNFTSSTPYCESPEPDCGYKSDTETSSETLPPAEKRRPGRPRGTRKKKKPEKLGRLWEFIRDLLLSPKYNPSLICWENYEEGTFRFVHSDKVAKLWGSKKDNIDMNYEKLSRAMRYYYKSKVLQPVYGKRLVYKFGPTAKGWQSEKPIFRHQG